MVYLLCGRDGVKRDLDRLEKWLCVNLVKFNQTKSKVLHMGQGSTKHKHGLGKESEQGAALGRRI